jgi:hypothetical protein
MFGPVSFCSGAAVESLGHSVKENAGIAPGECLVLRGPAGREAPSVRPELPLAGYSTS